MLTAVFIAGVGSGWLGKTWLEAAPSELAGNNQGATISSNGENQNISQSLDYTEKNSSNTSSINIDFSNSAPVIGQRIPPEGKPADALFTRLLNDRLYNEAIVLYQETVQQNEKTPPRLKNALLDHLRALSKIRNNSDFSELIERYLSIYYDDIAVLLLLAEFNQTNGNYFRSVDTYLLAKTYTYTVIDQNNLLNQLNSFVKETDNIYTNQKDWLALIDFYTYINTSGLMTSFYQYRQALAHLGNGDKLSATEQLKQLTSDSLVGAQATITLNRLTNRNGGVVTATRDNAIKEDSETVALQQRGVHYLIDLTVGRQDNIELLVDTGASITTLTQASFYSLSSYSDAAEQEKRIFHTANGSVQGTVYLVPELTIGPYLLENTKIAVLDFEMEEGIDGLLGMNVLGQFNFQIDQENKSLVLNRK